MAVSPPRLPGTAAGRLPQPGAGLSPRVQFGVEIVRRAGLLLTVQVTATHGSSHCSGGAAFFLEVLCRACDHGRGGQPQPLYPIEEMEVSGLERERVLAGDVAYLVALAPRFVLRAQLVHHASGDGDVGGGLAVDTFLVQVADVRWAEACGAGSGFSILSAAYSQVGGFGSLPSGTSPGQAPSTPSPTRAIGLRRGGSPLPSPAPSPARLVATAAAAAAVQQRAAATGAAGSAKARRVGEAGAQRIHVNDPGGRRRRRRLAAAAARQPPGRTASKALSHERIEQILEWQVCPPLCLPRERAS
eukprot:COSAG01_NODE_16365_length_1242_cov_1.686789_1_plen_302_part_00